MIMCNSGSFGKFCGHMFRNDPFIIQSAQSRDIERADDKTGKQSGEAMYVLSSRGA